MADETRQTTPRVFNKRHRDAPFGAIYVGRPGAWGNPFVGGIDGTRDEVVAKLRSKLMADPAMLAAAKRDLRGKHLVCFCAPLACHADVLLEIANA